MPDENKRLERALSAAKELEEALPKPPPKRDQRIVLYLTAEEHGRIEAFAEDRDESLAVAARGLVLAALKTLGK